MDSGRRPELESDEFSVTTPLVVEILGREVDTFPKKVYTYWDFGSCDSILRWHTSMQRKTEGMERRKTGRKTEDGTEDGRPDGRRKTGDGLGRERTGADRSGRERTEDGRRDGRETGEDGRRDTSM